jgi:hypothetical protein
VSCGRQGVLGAVALVFAGGCFLSVGDGHEWVTPRPPAASTSRPVVLYGIDEGAPERAAPACKRLGTVRAWSRGEKTFPYAELRAAAADVGGDGVTELRPDPANQERSRSVHLGVVVRCASD